jgi:hypothetical protein
MTPGVARTPTPANVAENIYGQHNPGIVDPPATKPGNPGRRQRALACICRANNLGQQQHSAATISPTGAAWLPRIAQFAFDAKQLPPVSRQSRTSFTGGLPLAPQPASTMSNTFILTLVCFRPEGCQV